MLINKLFIILLAKPSDVLSLNTTKLCNPVYNCPPGNEIRSCFETGIDTCQPCKPGTVQPDYISSHTLNKNCFEPMSSCLAADITYSRTRKDAFCDSLTGCKCNLAICFYGDPCLCGIKSEGCPENEFLEENGDCTPCPKGAEKNGTGCGPCMYFSVDVKRPVTDEGREGDDTGAIDNIEKAKTVATSTDSTRYITNVTSKPMVEDNCVSNKVVITLAVLSCVLVVIILALIYRMRNRSPLCIRKPHEQFEIDEMMPYLTDETDFTASESLSQNQKTIHLKNGRLA